MPVPGFEEFINVFLKVIGDGKLHSSKDIKDPIANELNISDDDRKELLPNGKQTKFVNRINWAKTYLNKAGLIETPSRGWYRITKEGIEALASGDKIDVKYLKKYDKFALFHNINGSDR